MKKHLIGIFYFLLCYLPLGYATHQTSSNGNFLHETIVDTAYGQTLFNVSSTLYLGQGNAFNCLDLHFLAQYNYDQVWNGMRIGTLKNIPIGFTCMVQVYRHGNSSATDTFNLVRNIGGGYETSYPYWRRIFLY